MTVVNTPPPPGPSAPPPPPSLPPSSPPPMTPPTREPRGCVATLVVLLIMVGIVVGGVVADSALADEPPRPITVGLGVTITPPPDWEFGGRSPDGNTILLSQGSGSLAITVAEGTDVRGALVALREEWVATGTVSATDITDVADVRPGQSALRFAYSGTFEDLDPRAAPVEGEVIGVAGTAVAVVFDGWAGFGDYVAVSGDIAGMIRATVIP